LADRAVRWYLRQGLSYRDVQELLAKRGIDHVTIYWWVQRFTPLAINAARPCRRKLAAVSVIAGSLWCRSGQMLRPLQGFSR
jgi:transposase-like protein|tara:strand:- start:770 stop:1015 length:246 start_codon:yes stop_codon:yes gene_type:complete